MKQALIILFTFIAIGTVNAQSFNCGFDARMNDIRNNNPRAILQESVFNQNLLTQINSRALGASNPDYTIPVVFHILHDPADSLPIAGTSNPTDSMVHQGLQYLNESFRNLEPYDTTQGVDVKIEFCLATQDTNGVYTSGITRHSGNTYIFSSNHPTFWQGANWDETQYLNIYIFSGGFMWGVSLGGFSTFPTSHGTPGDGFAITHYTLTNPTSGSIIAHEAGHYLGLYHTFNGGCTNQDCQVDGDRVCDTPPDASSTNPSACGDSINTCTSDTADLSVNNPFRSVSLGGLGDQLDPIYNYMDYTQGVCRLQFTQGQKDRMHASLTQTRASLLTSPACQVVCTNVISPSFSLSVDTLIAGDTLYFTNTSVNGVYYQWYIDGIPVSSAIDTAWVFVNEGTHQVLLEVYNDSTACGVLSMAQYTYVHCDITTSISAPTTNIFPGESITFTGQTSGANSYNWYVDGDSLNNTLLFTHTFPEPGMYEVKLKTSNGTCPDSSELVRVSVGYCKKGVDEKWVFGWETGWDFSSGLPSYFNVPGLSLNQASASAADENGNLLFYTDGEMVWNAQNVQMPNGDSLADNISGIQPVQILPVPGDSNLYYIFNSNSTGAGEMYYAVVDMRLDSARGDVISKKNIMASGYFRSFSATKHANGCDFWLITRQLAPFEIHCFPVTANGIGAPVITTLTGGFGAGQLDISPNGKKIAVGHGTYIVVGDFDNANGQITNPFNLTQIQQFVSAVLFSPGNNRLYAGGYTNSANSDRLSQFDLTLGSPAAIQSSVQLISIPEAKLRSLKRGPDGKVYGALENRNYMAGIEFPNELGASTHYSDQGTPNSPLGQGRLYLPNTIPTFGIRNQLVLQGPVSLCEGDQQIDYTLNCSDSTIWTYSGGGSIDTSSNTLLRINFGAAGVDTMVVWSSSSCGPDLLDTLIIQVNDLIARTDLITACDSYMWIDGNTYTSNNTTATHILPNTSGCDSVITLNLTINTVDNGITNSSPSLTATATIASYQWLDCDNSYALISGETNQNFIATINGNYAVVVTQNGCTDTSACETVNNVGVNEINSNILLHPNPTNDLITLEIEGYNGSFNVEIYDLQGRLLESTKSRTVSLKKYSKGIYVFRVSYGDITEQVRVLRD